MKITCSDYKTADMQALLHHLYEYNKGLRSLVLHTMNAVELFKAEELLLRKKISFHLDKVSDRKVNIFFGSDQCVEIVRSFGNKPLCNFTDEEDFILGIMLGYDRTQQCDRYLKKKELTIAS